MRSSSIFFVAVLVLFVLCVAAVAGVSRGPIATPRAITGEEPMLPSAIGPDNRGAPRHSLDEPIGTVFVAGTSWFDLAHNGTAGKMIGVDDSGYVHLVWTKGMDNGNITRHVAYNVWDPNTEAMIFADGQQIDLYNRAGFISLAVLPSGWAFPAFHEILQAGGLPHTAAAMDFIPYAGAFTVTEPAYLNDRQLIWPKIAVGRDSVLHMVSTENLIPYAQFYSRGIPVFPNGTITWQDVGGGAQFLQVGSSGYVTADVAAGHEFNRVAIVWTDYRPGSTQNTFNQDVFYSLSDDGGLNWGAPFNLSQFTVQDTHRAFADVSVIFDDEDFLHIAFTTSYFDESSGSASTQTGRIWHWSEATDTITALGDNWSEGAAIPGNVLRNACRPSLSQDTTTGYLYCSYQWYDIASWSQSLFYNGDVWMTVSTDGGIHWSAGRNVTETTPGQNPSPAGQCLSERDITLADHVTYANGTGYLHLAWQLDLDAGGSPTPEGVTTLNTNYYQRIPVDSIPQTPLLPHFAFHFGEIVPPDTGRCCYGNPGNPQCQDMAWVDCDNLAGTWDNTLTCDTPCPVFNCTCQDEPYTHCVTTAVPIPDGFGGGVDIPISVPVRYHITDLNVCFDISHPAVNQLVISLISPTSTEVTVFWHNVGGADFRCTVLDDSAATPIGQGTAPFNDEYQPHSPLSPFNGQLAEGNWILHVTDNQAGSSGTLNWVCLNFEYDYIDAVDENELIPVEYSLSAYPNPFNPVTTLSFGIEKAGNVRLDIFNVAGQRVRTLGDAVYAAGYHTITFDARDLPSGIYFAKINAGNFVKTEKLVMMK